MKRKIAILLSAMMVTSAVPFSVNAAQLKGDTVLNQGYARPNESIDPATKNNGYASFTKADQLRGRRSVLKIDLKDENTDLVPAGTSFYVDLENGKFIEELPLDKSANNSVYGYMNITDDKDGAKKLTYNEAKEYKTLTEVFNSLAKSTGPEHINEALDVETPTNEVAALQPLLTSLKDKLTNAGQIDDMAALDAKVKDEVDALLREIAKTGVVSFPELAHIPYSVEYVTPTRLKVTTLQPLTNKDTVVNVSAKGYGAGDLKVEYFTDPTCTTPFTTGADANTIKGIKVVPKPNTGTVKKDLIAPYIALPLGGVIADGDAPVKVKVTAEYNDKVYDNGGKGIEYTITKGLENSSTSLVYNPKSVKYFEDRTTLDQITIKENVRKSIGKNNDKSTSTFTVRLSSGFKFRNAPTSANFAAEGKAAGSPTFSVVKLNDSSVQVTVTGLVAERRDPIGIAMKDFEIEPIDDSRNYGDVEVNVSGEGISNQSVKVAVREKLGFKLETLKDPQDMISGRHYQDNNRNNMVEADNNTVSIKFSENIPNTLVTSRNLDFNVPEGVKIVRAEIEPSSIKNIQNLDDVNFDIINNGRTLRLNRDTYKIINNENNKASFVMKLNLSIDPSFTGDVKLNVVGGGQPEGATPELVIAKAKAPFEIKTQTTKVDLGYQDYNTADIVITETKPGMFLEGETATIGLVAPYGTGEVGFSEAKFEISGGELSIKEKDFGISKTNNIFNNNNNNNGGVISFKVDKASYKNPSTLTIKNVKIGSTRSVPFGSYSLAIGGKAVINNYQSQPNNAHATGSVIYDKKVNLLDANKASTANGLDSKVKSEVNGLRYQDKASYYEVKDYVNVVTATGTFNETVKVTVGEKTVLVGSKAIDMDVAPYIQASSNSTMVPLRFVSVALGVDTDNITNPDASNKIAWDANTKTTTIYYGAGTGQKIIQFQAGSNIMTVDGTKIPMEYGVKAEIKDGRMFVPFRALGQALGVTVTWNPDTRTAIYNENNARNANSTTTTATSTTATSTTGTSTTATTVSGSTTATTTTSKESSTESTTASKDSTTETTTVKK